MKIVSLEEGDLEWESLVANAKKARKAPHNYQLGLTGALFALWLWSHDFSIAGLTGQLGQIENDNCCSNTLRLPVVSRGAFLFYDTNQTEPCRLILCNYHRLCLLLMRFLQNNRKNPAPSEIINFIGFDSRRRLTMSPNIQGPSDLHRNCTLNMQLNNLLIK